VPRVLAPASLLEVELLERIHPALELIDTTGQARALTEREVVDVDAQRVRQPHADDERRPFRVARFEVPDRGLGDEHLAGQAGDAVPVFRAQPPETYTEGLRFHVR
jgi:hypothetical protein